MTDFPDSRIGASLKRRLEPDWMDRHRHFPDSRIGASLKRRGAEPARRQLLGLPRFANRGLIEAKAGDGSRPAA